MRTFLFTVSLLALSAPAFAQGMPLPPMGGPMQPLGAPMQPMQPVPAPAMPRALPPLPSSPEAQAQAQAGSPAAMPAQPDGGFTRLPTGEAAPRGNRQNLSGAADYTKTLAQDGSNQLGNMTQGVTAPAPTAQLDGAPIANQGDLEAITSGQRNIVVLKQKVEEAKLAVELWHVLYNNDDAKQMREKDEKAAEAKATEAKAKEKEQQAQAATVNAGAAMASAMRNLAPVAPQVVEVNGSRALLLVQGGGEVWVRAGSKVEGGWKVVSVAPKGIMVNGPNGRQMIGYGATLQGPQVPAMPAMPQAPRVASPAPRI